MLAVGDHYQGKGGTVALERNNGQQRHWTAALRRRSIVVSKSLAMIERRVALFAHLHVNKEAAPELDFADLGRIAGDADQAVEEPVGIFCTVPVIR